MNSKSAWVVGASGFVGSHLTDILVSKGYRVRAVGRRPSSQNQARSFNLDLMHIKKYTPEIEALLKQDQPQTVFYCSAYGVNPALSSDLEVAFQVNSVAPYVLAELCNKSGVQSFVCLGSCFEYGSKEGAIDEEMIPRPTALYGASKAAGTMLMQEVSLKLDTKVIIPRLFGQWGPREEIHRLVPQLIKAAKAKTTVALTMGEQLRDFMYVKDTARILWKLSESNCPTGEIINIGVGEPVRVKDFVLNVARQLDIEDLLKFGEIPYREREMMSLVANTEKMKKLVQVGVLTSIEQGVSEMLQSSV